MAFDLTGTRWLKSVVKHPLFPALLQWCTLAVFTLLILYGWNYHDIRGVDLPDPLVYTNVATLFFWVIWLMGLILLVPFIGRLWCTVCPLGYMNDLLARYGFRLRYPRFLRNLTLAAVLLIFYNLLVAFFNISHYPDYSARLLLGITALLLVVGIIFRGRIFCGYLCPIGAMIGVYSRTSPWHLTVRDREVCRSCPSKACYQGEVKWHRLSTPLGIISFPFRRPGCQVDLFPPELVEDPRCVMCTQCIKNCPYDNIRWGTRPFLRGVVLPGVPRFSEALFLVFLMGATLSIFTRVWPGLSGIISAPGAGLTAALGLSGSRIGQVLQLLWGYTVFPFLLVLLLAGLTCFLARSRFTLLPGPPAGDQRERISFGLPEREGALAAELTGWEGKRLTVWGIFSALTISLVPLILSAHAAFALIKVNEKLAYLPGALRDPSGVKFYLAIHQLGMMAAPRELIPLEVIRWPALLLVLAGIAASLYSVVTLAGNLYADVPAYRRWSTRVFGGGIILMGGVLATLIIKWLFS